MAISFHTQSPVLLKNRSALKAFLTTLFVTKGKTLGSLYIIFCSDEYLKDINKQFLQHDHFTDIVTFNLNDNPKQPIEGEIYISIDRVKENAHTYKTPQNRELHRVIFHGALHLCGYNDKTIKEKAMMTAEEDICLNSYFDVPRGT